MMTEAESTANAMSQSIDYNNYTVNRSYPTTAYNYRHDNSWEKANYGTFHHQSSLFSTGGISSINKFYHPSFNAIPNLNNTNPNFYRRHTESTLQTSTSLYPSSTSNHSSNVPFNYSNHSSGLFFDWNNNGSSLMRTQSASYQDYAGSTSYPSYSPITSSQLTANDKSTVNSRVSQMASNNPYPSFYNIIPPINFPLTPPSSIVTSTISQASKLSVPSKKSKRPRLTAHVRNEILKLKANKPTIFVWEIQQNLLQNGICTAQTLPSPTVIQRVLTKSSKNNSATIKEEPKVHVNLPSRLNPSSSVTICLSPSPSPTLSNGESISECSICLESYRSGQEVSILACSHEYHSSCIGEWMLKNRSCPMCRKDIHNQPQFVTLLI
ncbi:unnamed protein product [Rotaria socialis]|uniref:RING-type domain-containing protein n=1 Tax=Rotaria socialis TaxID=392032 RepID=A0A818MI26_9BILA|nr:unnamed protein product [Rotaria socialis]CAF3389892.1 unnamed protein product [Rotaria socialis]CAF3414906.1 unnamed protein product [Rotaria socialis]CAF3519319.1 unnamed protein product [Rotaria socialis]CAF3588388.1 unnamed protein product [Rotaria socialis]